MQRFEIGTNSLAFQAEVFTAPVRRPDAGALSTPELKDLANEPKSGHVPRNAQRFLEIRLGSKTRGRAALDNVDGVEGKDGGRRMLNRRRSRSVPFGARPESRDEEV
jgi:hypothetical protein